MVITPQKKDSKMIHLTVNTQKNYASKCFFLELALPLSSSITQNWKLSNQNCFGPEDFQNYRLMTPLPPPPPVWWVGSQKFYGFPKKGPWSLVSTGKLPSRGAGVNGVRGGISFNTKYNCFTEFPSCWWNSAIKWMTEIQMLLGNVVDPDFLFLIWI